MKPNSIFFGFLLLLFLHGCTKDLQPNDLYAPVNCDSTEFSFANDIKPLFAANCSGSFCHSGENSNYNYRNYEVIADRVKSGRLEERLLLPESDPMHMPVGRSLSPCELFRLRTWIRQGIKNN